MTLKVEKLTGRVRGTSEECKSYTTVCYARFRVDELGSCVVGRYHMFTY